MVINSILQLTLQHNQTQLTTLESIYHTFNFVFSVTPEVNLDVHPCGLDHICEHQRATKLPQRLTKWCVSPSLQTKMLYPPAVTVDCGAV